MMTNEEIMNQFAEKYPDMNFIDYRPLIMDYVEGKEGIIIWLDNGDCIIYFPKEGD